jgi:hypothetical protein
MGEKKDPTRQHKTQALLDALTDVTDEFFKSYPLTGRENLLVAATAWTTGLCCLCEQHGQSEKVLLELVSRIYNEIGKKIQYGNYQRNDHE